MLNIIMDPQRKTWCVKNVNFLSCDKLERELKIVISCSKTYRKLYKALIYCDVFGEKEWEIIMGLWSKGGECAFIEYVNFCNVAVM